MPKVPLTSPFNAQRLGLGRMVLLRLKESSTRKHFFPFQHCLFLGLYDVALVTLLFCAGIYTKGTAAATVSDTSTPTWQCVLAFCWPWRLCCSLPNGWTTGTLMVELFSEDYAITHLDIAVTGSRVNQNLTWPCPDRLAPCLLSGYSF